MKILVPIKRVVDANVRVRLTSDGMGVDTANLKMVINPFDEIALEQAVRLREAGAATEVVVVTIGPSQAQDVLRGALAVGADRAILIESEVVIEPLGVAKILAAVARAEGANLALVGKQAIDDDAGQTGQMLAALLGWPQATFASSVELASGVARVTREVDGGLQEVELDLPAVITADLRLNTPRFASLPNIMKARKKPIEEKPIADYGIDVAARLTVVATEGPPARKPGVIVGSVAELVTKLQTEARVI